MEYKIHVSPGVDDLYYGIEVQPPLTDDAFSGVRAAIMNIGLNHRFPTVVELTRQDAEGTAFIIGNAPNTPLNIASCAEQIGRLIDPCGLHETIIHSQTDQLS